MPNTPHPIWRIVRGRYEHLKDFAQAIGYGPEYVSRLKVGTYPISRQFRARAVEVLGKPESELFHDEDPPEVGHVSQRAISRVG